MTTKELSDTFDVLYNNITSNQAPGLNEYEKSVFLTKAQDEIVKNYFIPEGNPKQKGFDANQKRQVDFSMLISTAQLGMGFNAVGVPIKPGVLDPRGFYNVLPKDTLYIINETLQLHTLNNESVAGIRQVVPLSYDEYMRLMSKPFKEPLKYQAWRLIVESTEGIGVDIIMTSYDLKKHTAPNKKVDYIVRYVRQPKPIILTNLTDTFGENLTIHGEANEMTSELDPAIHEEILQRAVELAKIAWAGEPAATVQAGQRSE